VCKNAIGKAVRSQGLVLVAAKNHGKTNSLGCIVSNLQGIPVVCDYATQHCFKLGSQFQVRFLNASYWRVPKIRISKPIILDFSQNAKKQSGKILRDIIKQEYYSRVEKVIQGFRLGKDRKAILARMPWQIWAIEESQDLIGRYLKQDSDLSTAMACGRNFKISFIYLSQRIADLNTSLVERCAYLIGKQLGDNNLRKVSRILGIGRKKLKFIETLKQGEFIFYNGEKIERVQFPLFQGYGRAYEYERQLVQRKRKGLWEKMREAFKPRNLNLETETDTEPAYNDLETEEDRDFEEDSELEEEEDFILLEEDFEDF